MTNKDLRVAYKRDTGYDPLYNDYLNENIKDDREYAQWLEEKLVNLINETHKNINDLK